MKDSTIEKDFINSLKWVSNPSLIFRCDFLINSGNLHPFVRMNKKKEQARR